MLNNPTSFQDINFGGLANITPLANLYYTIQRPARGEVFVLRSKWIPEGSFISFDNGTEFDLVPLQPYFVSFNHSVTVRIRNPFVAVNTGQIFSMTDIKGISFLNKSEYYVPSQEMPFNIVYWRPTGFGFDFQPVLGSKYAHLTLMQASSANAATYKVVKNYAGGFAPDYAPCIGYLCYDTLGASGSGYVYKNDYKKLCVENNGDSIRIEEVYTQIATTNYVYMTFCDTGDESYNESIITDRKPGLTPATTYVWTYQLPRHAKNLYYRISDNGGVAPQNIWLSVLLPQTSILVLVSGAAVTSIGGVLNNMGSYERMRIVILTHAANINDMIIDLCWKH